MPLLIVASLLGLPLAFAVGALGYKSVTDDTTAVVQNNTPNLALIAGLALAGFALWTATRK